MIATDTIFAVSSGAPPAAIGIVRISGPAAGPALRRIAGEVPPPRHATLARLRREDGAVLDEALILWFPGPRSATGEDCAELHCHGGRAVLAAVCDTLSQFEGLRPAMEGEFTRRAFATGRIDLAEAEGLADLLAAETELQRSAAIANAGGALSRKVEDWRMAVLGLSAEVEAVLDFSDEDDSADLADGFDTRLSELVGEIEEQLARPRSEALNNGFRVALAGPPNAGKSTLFNALIESEAAIVSPIAGTTRDVIERPVAIAGMKFVFVDTAGVRDEAGEEIEAIGIERARTEFERADLVLWLGPDGEGPAGAWEIASRSDDPGTSPKPTARHFVSAVTGENIEALKRDVVDFARTVLPKPGAVVINARQYRALNDARDSLKHTAQRGDPLLKGEGLREARMAFDRLVGRSTTEDMLDALFGRFCIGK
ncbi:MAG: tRNA uridine-5-carboxymethylaminomethyl(34) synthesis GTPase MnmE [Erythrobacter sp.]